MSAVVEKDLQYVWHPFTHLKTAGEPVNIVSSSGTCYVDEHGRKYIDGISSWWVNIHGHSHPYIAEKVTVQMKESAHSIFSGFTHPQAVRLAERVSNIVPLHPKDQQRHKVFFSDDGSTSVEVAIKMALQFFHNKGENRTKIISFENSYHGDTFGGMSIAARNAFNNAFSKLLFDVIHIPLPVGNKKSVSFDLLKEALNDSSVAAFIFEPLVQGAGGMMMYDAGTLDEMIELCRAHQVICIADEVMTGFGRTGKMFACEYLLNRPDIMCLSKGLTGGFMPLGVTVASDFIYQAYVTDDKMKTFFHGHSYTANPVACSAANASLDLFEQEPVMKRVAGINNAHLSFAEKIRGHRALNDVRVLGSILAMELKTPGETEYLNPVADKISSWFLNKGIILRPLGNIFYVLPPYCIEVKELEYIYSQIELFLNEC